LERERGNAAHFSSAEKARFAAVEVKEKEKESWSISTWGRSDDQTKGVGLRLRSWTGKKGKGRAAVASPEGKISLLQGSKETPQEYP